MSMSEVATGKTPFDGMTSEQVSHELRTKDSRPNIPDNMYDLVDGKYIKLMRKAWSTNPDDRPSMPAIVHELQRICKVSGPSPLQAPSAPSANGGSKAEEKARQQLRAENEKIRKEKDEAIARLKRENEAKIEKLKREQEQALKDADLERARKRHEKKC